MPNKVRLTFSPPVSRVTLFHALDILIHNGTASAAASAAAAAAATPCFISCTFQSLTPEMGGMAHSIATVVFKSGSTMFISAQIT